MIDDCIQLAVEARVLRASVEQNGRGIVLAKYRNQWTVWNIFRAKKSVVWNCTEGAHFNRREDAEFEFAERVENSLPEISCHSCGYYYDDPEEGCDACVGKKLVKA